MGAKQTALLRILRKRQEGAKLGANHACCIMMLSILEADDPQHRSTPRIFQSYWDTSATIKEVPDPLKIL